MTKREAGFLAIGIGAGLLAGVFLVIAPFLYHHEFILGFDFRFGSVLLAIPFILIITGAILIFRNRRLA